MKTIVALSVSAVVLSILCADVISPVAQAVEPVGAPKDKAAAAKGSTIRLQPGVTVKLTGNRALLRKGSITGTYDCSCSGGGGGECYVIQSGSDLHCSSAAQPPCSGTCQLITKTQGVRMSKLVK